MKTIDRRIRRLQGRLCPDNGQPQRLWVLTQPGCELALDLDRCTEILDERGVLPTGRFGVLNLMGIPNGLSAKELVHFLRSGPTGVGRPSGSWSTQAPLAQNGT